MRLIDADKVGSGMAETWQKVIIRLEVEQCPTIDPETLPEVIAIKKQVAELTTEKDAIIKDLKNCAVENYDECNYCKNKLYRCVSVICENCKYGSNFKWRGYVR